MGDHVHERLERLFSDKRAAFIRFFILAGTRSASNFCFSGLWRFSVIQVTAMSVDLLLVWKSQFSFKLLQHLDSASLPAVAKMQPNTLLMVLQGLRLKLIRRPQTLLLLLLVPSVLISDQCSLAAELERRPFDLSVISINAQTHTNISDVLKCTAK